MFVVIERMGWFYLVHKDEPNEVCDGPFRYRWFAQECADDLNGR